MFIVNGEILSQKNLPELYAWYQKKLKEIAVIETDYVTFSAHKFPHYETDDSGRKRKVQRWKSVPATSTINNGDFGNQTWTYVPSANSVKNEGGMVTPVNLKPFNIGQEITYSKTSDIDIIFYLLYISEALRNKKIFHIDRKSDSIKEAKRSAVAAEAQYLLFSEESPISPKNSGSEEAIHQIAISFGVPDVKSKHIAEVRNDLWKIILIKERSQERNKFGFAGLINAVSRTKDSAKRANILIAVDMGFLLYEGYKWHLHMRGTFDKVLCNVPRNMEKERKEVLIEYILNNPEYLSLITEAVKEPDTKKVRERDVLRLEREEKIDECIILGWEKKALIKMKDSKLNEIIINEVQPEVEPAT